MLGACGTLGSVLKVVPVAARARCVAGATIAAMPVWFRLLGSSPPAAAALAPLSSSSAGGDGECAWLSSLLVRLAWLPAAPLRRAAARTCCSSASGSGGQTASMRPTASREPRIGGLTASQPPPSDGKGSGVTSSKLRVELSRTSVIPAAHAHPNRALRRRRAGRPRSRRCRPTAAELQVATAVPAVLQP